MAGSQELHHLLLLIERSPRIEGYTFNPLLLIRVVNALHSLGTAGALAAIDAYLKRLPPLFERGAQNDGEQVFLILRTLFDIPDSDYMEPAGLGLPDLWMQVEWQDLHRIFPRFPLSLVDDVPLLVTNGFILEGVGESPEEHLVYFREHGQLRLRPLQPGKAPLDTLDQVVSTVRTAYAEDDAKYLETELRHQILRLLDGAYQVPAAQQKILDSCEWEEHPKAWSLVLSEIRKLRFRWDVHCQHYFRD